MKIAMVRCTPRLLLEDLHLELRASGFTVDVIVIPGDPSFDIAETLRKVHPDMVLSVNLIEGLGRVCASLGLPYVVWEIDPNLWVPAAPSAEEAAWTHLFTWRRRHILRYRMDGYIHLAHLPLAASVRRRFRLGSTSGSGGFFAEAFPISFAGSSIVRGEGEAEGRLARQALAARLSRCRGSESVWKWDRFVEVLHHALKLQHEHPCRNLYFSTLEKGLRELGLSPLVEVEGRRMDLCIAFGRGLAAMRRLRVLDAVAEHEPRVFGDDGWERVLRFPLRYGGRLENGAPLNALYNGSWINLDIARLYQPDIVTLRVFDILAAGGFPLVESSDELPSLFELGTEVATWHDRESLRHAVRTFLEQPERRLAFVERGRARLFAEHTIAHRLVTMMEVLIDRGVLHEVPGLDRLRWAANHAEEISCKASRDYASSASSCRRS